MVDLAGTTIVHYTLLSEDEPAVVLDLGSHTIKAGFSGEDSPRSVVPTLMGVPRDASLLIGMD